jgi:hypothetical protein
MDFSKTRLINNEFINNWDYGFTMEGLLQWKDLQGQERDFFDCRIRRREESLIERFRLFTKKACVSMFRKDFLGALSSNFGTTRLENNEVGLRDLGQLL